MATWVSVTSVGARVAAHFERDLRLALCVEADLQIVPFQFDAAIGEVSPGQIGKTFATFLARLSGLAGVIWYETEALSLIESAPAHLQQVFALAEISGWQSAQSLMSRADIVGNLLTLKSLGQRINVCAPQTRAFASMVQAMFPEKIVDAPIPFAAGSGARDDGLSLGIPHDMSPEGWETLAPFIMTLSQEAADENAPPVRIYAPAEFFGSPYFGLLREIPGVSLIEGMSPDNRAYSGGDFLIGTASDIHQLDMLGRDAAVAGAALLILDRDSTKRATKILDAAGAAVPLAKLRTDPDFRSALRKTFNERAARVADRSMAFWRSLMLGGGLSGRKERCENIVDDAVYDAVTDRGAFGEETAASRAFLLSPASAQRALNLAGALSSADAAASWPLVALSNRLARGAANTPLRPPALDIGPGRLFVTDDQGPLYSPEQGGALQKWLDDLPAASHEATVKDDRRLAFSNETFSDGVISYSVGLSSNAEGQQKVSPGGALLFLKIDDPSETNELAVLMEFSLVGEQPAGRLDIEVVGGAARKIDLTSSGSRRVAIPAPTPEDPALGVMVKLIPRDLRWADIFLTSISVRSTEQRFQYQPEALAAVGFDLLETLPITAAVMSGAFGVEQDGDGHDFRWISRDLILELPTAPATAQAGEANSNAWLILKLRPNLSSHQTPLAGDIDLPGVGGKRVATALRRLGDIHGDVMLGAPVELLGGSGIARITLRSPNDPLSSVDSRLAAACLTDLWIASPSDPGRQAMAPRFALMNLANGTQFANGWYPLENVKGLPSRWMSRVGVLSSGFRPRPGSSIFLALAGLSLGRNFPTLVPFAVTFDGRPMSVRSRIDSPEGWALVLEAEAPDDSFGAEFEITAEKARVLAPNDPREASILASFAALLDPAGDAASATGAFGDAAVVNCALIIEHWGGGLSGAWLPPATIMVCARSAGTGCMVIEGAAATDTATLDGMVVEIDSERVETKLNVANDGSWTLRAPLDEASGGAALLLRLTAPRKGRAMLRRVGFE